MRMLFLQPDCFINIGRAFSLPLLFPPFHPAGVFNTSLIPRLRFPCVMNVYHGISSWTMPEIFSG